MHSLTRTSTRCNVVLSPLRAEIGDFWIDTEDRVLARIVAASTKLSVYSIIRTVAIRPGPAIDTTRIVNLVQKALGPGDWRYQTVNSAVTILKGD